MAKCRHPKRYVVETSDQRRCRACCAWLSLGPSNDDIPLSEIVVASCAHSDADLSYLDNEGALDWDVNKPLAEQWPWNGVPVDEEYAPEIQAIRDVADTKPPAEWQGAVFAAVDTASREPWRADGETQSTGELETQLRAAADEFMDGIGTVVPDGAA